MECATCNDIQNKKNILFEDDEIVIILEPEPAVPGHIRVVTKEHVSSLRDVSDELGVNLMKASSLCSTAVFELLGAQGSNIVANEGVEDHLCFHIIPRKMEDGLDFKWEPKQLPPEDMEAALSRLKDKAFFIGKEKPEMSQEPIDENEVVEFFEDEEDYMVKHVRRIP